MTTKFQPIEHFTSSDGIYQLLPFAFAPVSDHEVIVTNFVGEFLYLHREKLERLVLHQLDASDADYQALRARHFIKETNDTATLELLALKTRTRLSKLSNFTNLHLFVVTLRCDHACHYCQVSRQSEDRTAFDMTKETADRAIDVAFGSPNPALKIEFQGGEPLLNLPLIRYIVENIEQRNQVEKRDLQFVIATTLSLATREILEYCRDHSIQLSTSLDGPEDLHNWNRPRPGRDSYQRFEANLKIARDILGYDSVSAVMTTSPKSLRRVKDIIDEYIKLGFRSIFLRPLSPFGFALKTKSYNAYNAADWLEFYRDGMDYIIQLNKQGIEFTECYSSFILKKMFSDDDPMFVDLMNPSGAGISAVVFNYDGDVYASDESRMLNEMGDSSFKLGNVHTATYKEIFSSDALLSVLDDSFTSSIPMCSDCAFERWCGADPVFHHATQGDIIGRKPTSEFCKRMMGMFHYLLAAMRTDKATKTIFMNWANS
jgi:uncharacterized protein